MCVARSVLDNYGNDLAGYKSTCLPCGTMSTACAVSVLINDQKQNIYFYVFWVNWELQWLLRTNRNGPILPVNCSILFGHISAHTNFTGSYPSSRMPYCYWGTPAKHWIQQSGGKYCGWCHEESIPWHVVFKGSYCSDITINVGQFVISTWRSHEIEFLKKRHD